MKRLLPIILIVLTVVLVALVRAVLVLVHNSLLLLLMSRCGLGCPHLSNARDEAAVPAFRSFAGAEQDRGRGVFCEVASGRRTLEERAMNWDRIEGNWKEFKGKAKQQWGKLTDDDLDVIDGKQDQLEGRLQQRYGYAKDQAAKEVNDWYGRQTW